MLTSLIIVSFFFAFAWAQQIFLNQLIQADLKALQQSRSGAAPAGVTPPLHPADS
ncbi:MAG: hypothetical protein F6K00_06140 [Leptolyngbya sp. SIOISBB]|nr:hypothetical protein [Leptolyngbya sp. SIOISBB]